MTALSALHINTASYVLAKKTTLRHRVEEQTSFTFFDWNEIACNPPVRRFGPWSLAISSEPIDKLASMTNKICEASSTSSVFQISKTSENVISTSKEAILLKKNDELAYSPSGQSVPVTDRKVLAKFFQPIIVYSRCLCYVFETINIHFD